MSKSFKQFELQVKHLCTPEDFNNNSGKLKKLRPYGYETFIYLLKIGGGITKSLRACQVIFKLSTETPLTESQIIKISGITSVQQWLDNTAVSHIKTCISIADLTNGFVPSKDYFADSLKCIEDFSVFSKKQYEKIGNKGKYQMTFQNGSIISAEFINEASFGRGNSPIPEQPFIRSFSEILIDADNSNTKKELQFFYDEFMFNRKKFPLIYKRFAEEHFELLKDKLNI